MTLPEWYIKWISRVSDVVSFIYPFEGEGKQRYLQWLKKVKVEENLYLTTAQTTWTYIHQVMEDYVNGEPLNRNKDDCPIVKKTIDEGLAYIDWIKKKYTKKKGWKLVAEPVLRDKDNRYQWSSDLVLIHEKKKKVIIVDWKSFGIAKSFFSLPNNYKKPYDKIKKGRLQFSLYWEVFKQKGYEVEDLVLVYLHEDCAYPYSLEQYSSEELDVILAAFELNTKTLEQQIININPDNMFNIEILHPTVQYGNIKLSCNLQELDNWDTIPETLEKMCKTAKVVSNEMKKD